MLLGAMGVLFAIGVIVLGGLLWIGTRRLAEIVARREAGLLRPADTQLATDLAQDIVASALCDHERLATLPLTSGMRYFASAFDPDSRPTTAATGS